MHLLTLFSKTKYPVIKASYGMLISTVILQSTKKHAILSRLGVFIKRNAWDVSSIRHVTCIRIPKERHQLLRFFFGGGGLFEILNALDCQCIICCLFEFDFAVH